MEVITIDAEPESNEFSQNTHNKKRAQPSILKSHGTQRADSTASNAPLTTLRADDIEEHRWWSLISCILCFCIIAPVMAFYHSRRVRKMKANQELARAQRFSERIHNLLIFSMIVGIIIWVAVIVVLGILFVMGAVLNRM